jgi:Mor family transcriptional regulator
MSTAFLLLHQTSARPRPPVGAARPGPDADSASVLDAITRLLGPAAVAALVEQFGGRRIYIPFAAARGDLLNRAIRLGQARKLAKVFGGDRIYVPADLGHARRRTRIAIMRERGLSVTAIARTLRCTERYVYKVLALTKPRSAPNGSDGMPPAERGS